MGCVFARGDTALHILCAGRPVRRVKPAASDDGSDDGAPQKARKAAAEEAASAREGGSGGGRRGGGEGPSTEAVRELLSHGASPSASNHSDWAPLALAARNGFAAATTALIEGGADPMALNPKTGDSVLLAAARHRDGPNATRLLGALGRATGGCGGRSWDRKIVEA
jgi:hypothetical protein